MQQAFSGASGLSSVVDRTYSVGDPGALFRGAERLLAGRGFAVQQVEPPLPGMTGTEFRAGLRGERDVVLDAKRRKIGKWLVIGGALMTAFTLAVIVSGEERYWVFDWLLTGEVLMGGYGLMQLRNPPDRRRTVVEIALAGEASGLHVAVQQGVGRVEDDVIFDWLADQPVDVKADEIDALVAEAGSSEASA
jgi:hypothetical protein